jgi:hypothetical protein
MVRWSLRHDDPRVYLFAVLWTPTLTLFAGVGLLASAHTAPGTLFGVDWALARKGLAIVLCVVTYVQSNRKPLRFYRRNFSGDKPRGDR